MNKSERAELEKRLYKLFEELVPESGKADTVAGEIVRATMRITYRYWHEVDSIWGERERIGVGYGRGSLNPAGRYLIAQCGAGSKVQEALDNIWGERNDDKYDAGLTELLRSVLEHLDKHQELATMTNIVNMWSFRDDEEDIYR